MLVLLHCLVFLSSFLLFQVELMASKAMLPGFGGSYLVWGISVMVFQALLLLGYGYAHLAGRLAQQAWFRRLQVLVPLAPLFLFPIPLRYLTARQADLPFALDIAWTILSSIGLCFFVLSSLSILLQRYLSSARLRHSANPYVLYATSNLGSFSGLLSYPLLVEPFLGLGRQLAVWQILYAITALVFLFVHFWAGRLPQTHAAALASQAPGGARSRLSWLLLSCAGTALFLSVTNVITFDLASAPLIWVAPLALYLLSFVLTFKERPWYPDWLEQRFPLLAAAAVLLFGLQLQSYTLPILALLGVHLAVLLCSCVICHGELNRARPTDVRELAAFYIYLSLGGFLGSVLVGWVIPLLSNAVVEYAAGFALLAAGLALRRRERLAARDVLAPLALAVILALWSYVVGRATPGASSLIAAAAGLLLALVFFAAQRRHWSQALALLAALLLAQGVEQLKPGQTLLAKHRNFYGIYTIYDQGDKRFLKHGTTLHGAQFLSPERQNIALTYYHRTNPAGELLASDVLPLERVAIIGLGAGSLAAYGRPRQDMTFYELDPYNIHVAQNWFTFLRNCKAHLRLTPGDARLSLEKESNVRFDALLVDAFNSDSIPMHLITVEAMELYLQRLMPDGVVLFHISNKFLDLEPVLLANAREIGAFGLLKRRVQNIDPDAEATIWGALTRSRTTARYMRTQLHWLSLEDCGLPRISPWTDRYSNILAAFK